MYTDIFNNKVIKASFWEVFRIRLFSFIPVKYSSLFWQSTKIFVQKIFQRLAISHVRIRLRIQKKHSVDQLITLTKRKDVKKTKILEQKDNIKKTKIWQTE